MGVRIHDWFAHKAKQVLSEKPRGVIHMGAHIGEEIASYEALGITRQLWFEPVPENFDQLVKNIPQRPEVRAFRMACSNEEGRRIMELSRFSQVHSLSKLKRQVEIHPSMAASGNIEVDVVRLDDFLARSGIDPKDYNLMVVDTQGCELETLKGAEKTLEHMDCVMAELGTIELYEGMALDDAVDAWMAEHGFRHEDSNWFGPNVDGRSTYGDAFYVRTK